MSTRSRDTHRRYIAHRQKNKGKKSCTFCEIKPNDNQFVEETSSFMVIDNIFPYSLWDDQTVEDHLMIIPKNHIDTLSHLSPKEAKEYVELMSAYESRGYNVMARAPQSIRKTVVHQHTHLIKPSHKKTRILLYVEKPYLRILF